MKGRILSFLLFLVCSSTIIQAQDILTKRNGDEMQVKVTEVTLDEIKYKRFTNISGPTFVMDKSEIFMIKYENGDKDLFEKDPVTDRISIRHIAGQAPVIPQVPASAQVAPEKETNKVAPDPPKSQPIASGTSQKPTGNKEQSNQASRSSTPSVQPTLPEVKPVSGKYYASRVEVWNKTYTISIGRIDKNERGDTRIELLVPEFGEALPPQGYPFIACMVIGNDTIQPNHLNIGRDTKNMQCAYGGNSHLPEKILILACQNDTYVPYMLFDGKTKEVLGSNEMPVETKASPPVFDASKGEHDLVDLIDNKIVEVKIKGSDITNVIVSLHRLVSYPVKIKVPVGSFFVSANTSKQNMVGTAERKIILNTDNWTNLSVPAACANRPRDIPGSNDSFSVTRSPHQAELAKLMPGLAKAGANTLTKQAAVWIITDNASYADLGILQRNGYARAIGPVETARAMQICSQSGIDIKSKRIWNDKDYILENLSDSALKNWLKEQ